jgi:hypothetical protein
MGTKEPKENCATMSWDHFENYAAQLEAIKQTARLLDLQKHDSQTSDG